MQRSPFYLPRNEKNKRERRTVNGRVLVRGWDQSLRELQASVLEPQVPRLTQPHGLIARYAARAQFVAERSGRVHDGPPELVEQLRVAVVHDAALVESAGRRRLHAEGRGQPLRSEERDHAALRRARGRDEDVEPVSPRVDHEEDEGVVGSGEEEVEDVGNVLVHERAPLRWPSLAVDVFQSETGV